MTQKIYVVKMFRTNGHWGGHSTEVKSYHASRRSADVYVQ